MKKILSLITVLLVTIFLVLESGGGCCTVSESLGDEEIGKLEESTETGAVHEDKNKEDYSKPNSKPTAVIDIFQQNSDGLFFEKDNPVYLSASNSLDPDGDELSYAWVIGQGEEIQGEKISYLFEDVGDYEIFLSVSDGIDASFDSRAIEIGEIDRYIIPEEEHSCIVEIEYTLGNKGPGDITDILCAVETPQTHYPFQVVTKRMSGSQNFKELFDDNWNLITLFELGNLAEGESITVSMDCDVVVYEYNFKSCGEDFTESSKGIENIDLEAYTKSEAYIDSDSPLIVNAVRTVVKDETDPITIAESLHNFVADKLEYDNQKLERGNYEYMYASEIMEEGKGVCADYSILYTALLRAAGIPAKLVEGIPILSILNEESRELNIGHAWVEVMLPWYGWVPIDVTSESKFMSYNNFLNLKTYEGSAILHKSLTPEGNNYCPSEFFYSWHGETKPEASHSVTYRVRGIEAEDIGMISEGAFLKKVSSLLGEYSAAVNHVNVSHSEGYTFNDPVEIAIEETFLVKLQELSGKLKNFSYPQSYSKDRNNLVKITEEISLYKESQISHMKNNNYNSSIDSHSKFTDVMDSLFNYYNYMVDAYNNKYNN